MGLGLFLWFLGMDVVMFCSCVLSGFLFLFLFCILVLVRVQFLLMVTTVVPFE